MAFYHARQHGSQSQQNILQIPFDVEDVWQVPPWQGISLAVARRKQHSQEATQAPSFPSHHVSHWEAIFFCCFMILRDESMITALFSE